MSSHYLLDGYNLIFTIYEEDSSLEAMREELLESLEQMAARLKLRITLVFDAACVEGLDQRGHFGHLEVIFSSGFKSADDYLIALLNDDPHPEQCVVVTSDRELIHRAKIAGAHTERSKAFWKRLEKKSRMKILNDMRREQKPSPKAPQPKTSSQARELKKPDETATLTECFDYYLASFEKRLHGQ